MHSLRSQESNDKFCVRIPKIIWELNLDVYEVVLYCYIKNLAGEEGVCTLSRQDMHKKLGMSRSKLSCCIAALKQYQPLLGKALIESEDNTGEDGATLPCSLSVVDIWAENLKNREHYS